MDQRPDDQRRRRLDDALSPVTETERLSATEAIRQLKQRYTRLFDTKDWTGLRQIYAPQIYIDIRADLARNPEAQAAIPDGIIRGPARVVAFLREIGEAVTTVHHIHGMEIVTVARKNYERYADAVERMRYYAQLGVEFRVCALAAADYGYDVEDFHDFVTVVPSAITELAHWQLQGYALITPQVLLKTIDIDSIR